MKTEYTILYDSREKKPLLFPNHLVMLDPRYPADRQVMVTVKLNAVRQQLKTGDYALQGYESLAVIERKGSLKELAHNCFVGPRRKNFVAELERLRPYRRRILLLEGTLTALLGDPEGLGGADAMLRLIREYGIEFMLIPSGGFGSVTQRTAGGEWVARLLINESLIHDVPTAPTISPTASAGFDPRQADGEAIGPSPSPPYSVQSLKSGCCD